MKFQFTSEQEKIEKKLTDLGVIKSSNIFSDKIFYKLDKKNNRAEITPAVDGLVNLHVIFPDAKTRALYKDKATQNNISLTKALEDILFICKDMKPKNKIVEKVTNLLEYIEEPDAFETKSEENLDKEFQNNQDKQMKAKEVQLRVLYEYLKARVWCNNCSLENNEITFTYAKDNMPAYLYWKRSSHLVDNFKLREYDLGTSVSVVIC